MVEAYGLALFPFQTPDTVHADLALLAKSVGRLDRSGGMRNVRLLAATISNGVLTIDR